MRRNHLFALIVLVTMCMIVPALWGQERVGVHETDTLEQPEAEKRISELERIVAELKAKIEKGEKEDEMKKLLE